MEPEEWPEPAWPAAHASTGSGASWGSPDYCFASSPPAPPLSPSTPPGGSIRSSTPRAAAGAATAELDKDKIQGSQGPEATALVLREEQAELKEREEQLVAAAEYGAELLQLRRQLEEQLREAEEKLQHTKRCAAAEAEEQRRALQAAAQEAGKKQLMVENARRCLCLRLQPLVREHEQLERETAELVREAKRRRLNMAQSWASDWNQGYYEQEEEARREHWEALEQQALAESGKEYVAARKRLRSAVSERDAVQLEIHRIRKERAEQAAFLREHTSRLEALHRAGMVAREAETQQEVAALWAEWDREKKLRQDAHQLQKLLDYKRRLSAKHAAQVKEREQLEKCLTAAEARRDELADLVRVAAAGHRAPRQTCAADPAYGARLSAAAAGRTRTC